MCSSVRESVTKYTYKGIFVILQKRKMQGGTHERK